MNLRIFLSSKAISLCALGIGGILFAALAMIAFIDYTLIFLFAVLYLAVILCWLVISFLLERRRTERLEKLIKEIPEKYLLGEVLPPPVDLAEHRYYRILQEVSRSAIDMTAQAQKEKEDYCNYVESWIHEIKTPLTACSLILANGGNPVKLKTELKRADNLTESILYYARLRTADKDTQIKEFEISDIIDEAVKSQMELMIAAKIRVETEGNFLVYSDSKALCFIVKQLLINAAKYCPGCQVDIKAANGKIIIKDNGIGIPSYELRRVTERGFTGTGGRKLGGSTGMGLYIVKELCTKLDIGLQIDSIEGAYTCITLIFKNLTKL